MRRPAISGAKPRVSQPTLFPAPVGGWIANRSKAIGRSPQLPPGAAVLENWFPTATGAKLRRGSRRYATLNSGEGPVFSMFTYHVGTQEQMFAATMTAIHDVSNVTAPENPGVVVLSGLTGGNWVTCPMTTAGGNFLRGVNGTDTPWVYDGGSFGTTPALTFAASEQATPSDMSFVWSYKRRLFFIRKNTLDAYYLPVNQVGGEMTIFPMGAVFQLGGSLLFGASWSLDKSGAGGLSAQCVFITTEGEVAVYQGSNPDDAQDWSLVGVYRIGRPLGSQSFIRAGGDLIIATTVGFIPLSSAVGLDFMALGTGAISSPIEEAWSDAVSRRGVGEWQCVTWPDTGMVLIAPPISDEGVMFVANANTGAWCRFIGWRARCFAVWRGRLYFGSDGGSIVHANIGGNDEGATYTGRYMGLFDDLGTAAQRKIAKFARATLQSSVAISPQVGVNFDWNMGFRPAPNAEPAQVDNFWDSATWNEAQWDTDQMSVVYDRWTSVGGSGARIAPTIQITSGATIPIDAELISVEVTYTTGDVVT